MSFSTSCNEPVADKSVEQQQQEQQQLQQKQTCPPKVIFVTGNAGKLEDFRALLAERRLADCFDVLDVDLVEVQGSHEEIAVAKCRKAAELLGCPVVIEDTSLELVALGGLPGPYIKWFWKALRNEQLPQLLAAFPDKSATAKSLVAFTNGSPGAEVLLFHGECHGRLLDAPQGPPIHGWLPLFVPDGHVRSLAEMPPQERYRYYHRAKAFASFLAYYAGLRQSSGAAA